VNPIDGFAQEVVDRIEADDAADPGVRFDPITLMILFAIVGTVISHYVAKWLEGCDRASIRRPNFWQRHRLRQRIYRELAASERPELAQTAVVPIQRAILGALEARDEHEIGLALATMRQAVSRGV
jgi:hypothetical protein